MNMKTVIFAVLVLVSSSLAHADIYRYEDPEGTVHFTDDKPNDLRFTNFMSDVTVNNEEIPSKIIASKQFKRNMTSSEHLKYAKEAIVKKDMGAASIHLDAIPIKSKYYKEAKKLYIKIGDTEADARRKQQAQLQKDICLLNAISTTKKLKSSARDPESFFIESAIMMPNGLVCYTFRSRNGFGGMNRIHAEAIMNNIITSESDGYGFIKEWKKDCEDKDGEDITEGLKRVLKQP